MDNLDWLAELASDCLAYGEEHGLPNFVAGAHALVDALESDLGKRAVLATKPELVERPRPIFNEPSASNIVQFRPRRPSALELQTVSAQL
jgi:hypothetical protein